MGLIWRRDIDWGDDDDDFDDGRHYSYWGYDRTAFIVKWVLVAVFLFLILLWLVGGYYHAQSRMKKGLPPLLYHRVRASGLADPKSNQTSFQSSISFLSLLSADFS